MSWFRLSSAIFALWAVLFVFFPGFTNEFGGVGYVRSGHAEDWTQIVGLLSFGIAVLLNGAHVSTSAEARRVVARGVLACAAPCAILMTYWQLLPEPRWLRLDILNILALSTISYGMFLMGRPWTKGA